MTGQELRLGRLLAEAEAAEPVAWVDVVARNLRGRFGARSVSFSSVDLVERELVRLTEEGVTQGGRGAGRVQLEGSDYDTVLRAQELRQMPMTACHGKLNDDDAVLCLDWHGTGPLAAHADAMAENR